MAFNSFYCKAKDISQNKQGNLFAFPYLDHNVFKVTFFNKKKLHHEVNINELIGSECSIKPIDGLIDPMINVVFLDVSYVFMVVYNHMTQ